MTERLRNSLLFAGMASLLVAVGVFQSANLALAILNLCLISAIMTLGVNIQWGYAGLFNAGVMGFTALGGLAAVIISVPPVTEAWVAGGVRAVSGLFVGVLAIALGILAWKKLSLGKTARGWASALIVVVGVIAMRWVVDPAVEAIEAVEPAKTGFLGGFGLPIMFAWMAGGRWLRWRRGQLVRFR